MRKPSKIIIDWCKAQLSSEDIKLLKPVNYPVDSKIDEYAAGTKEKFVERFESCVKSEIENGNHLNISFNSAKNFQSDSEFEFFKKHQNKIKQVESLSEYKLEIDIVDFRVNRPCKKLTLNGLNISFLTLQISSTADTPNIEVYNCNIRSLVVAGGIPVSLSIHNSIIGVFKIEKASIYDLYINKCSVLDIKSPSPGEASPFVSNVVIENSFFADNSKNYILNGAQAYRNIRHHLKNMENIQMANLFHSLELRVERETDALPNRLIGDLYRIFSGYGQSAIRPIIFLVSMYFFTFVGAVIQNEAILGQDEKVYIGWRDNLKENSTQGEIYRNSLLALQPITNPLNILKTKSLVVPKSGGYAFLLAVEGVISIILIALSIFAIRRRFKIQ